MGSATQVVYCVLDGQREGWHNFYHITWTLTDKARAMTTVREGTGISTRKDRRENFQHGLKSMEEFQQTHGSKMSKATQAKRTEDI